MASDTKALITTFPPEKEAIIAIPVPPHKEKPILKDQIEKLWEKWEADSKASGKTAPGHEQESLNWALECLPVSLFPPLPRPGVIEVRSDASVADTVELLTRHRILSAPVRDVSIPDDASWIDRYQGIVDYPGIILWVLEQADLLGRAMAATAAGVGAVTGGMVGAVAGVAGAAVLGATGVGIPLGAAVAGAALGGGAMGGAAGGSPMEVAQYLGDDFFKVLHDSELFQKTQVGSIAGTFRWAPFLPVQVEDSLLTLLLLISKYRLRSVPVVETGKPGIYNYVTQSSGVEMLVSGRGTLWFDRIADKTLSQLGLPAVPSERLILVDEDTPVLRAFELMRDHSVGGLPIVGRGSRKLVGSIATRDIGLLLKVPGMLKPHKSVSVGEFMEAARVSSAATEETAARLSPLVTVGQEDTLWTAMEKVLNSRSHRIYVADPDSGDVLGVVTLRDMISKFVQEPEGYFGNFFGGIIPGVYTSQGA